VSLGDQDGQRQRTVLEGVRHARGQHGGTAQQDRLVAQLGQI
jgi:hypothetical protein